MLYNAKLSQDISRDLFAQGVYAIGFFFPVVPQGQARIRTQLSSGHDIPILKKALEAFKKVGDKHGILGLDKKGPEVRSLKGHRISGGPRPLQVSGRWSPAVAGPCRARRPPESGELRVLGTPNRPDNAVVVIHPMTADTVTGEFTGAEAGGGSLIGPGRALDTDRFCVVCRTPRRLAPPGRAPPRMEALSIASSDPGTWRGFWWVLDAWASSGRPCLGPSMGMIAWEWAVEAPVRRPRWCAAPLPVRP
jgi:hypothetical protein